ncbi:DUF5134 domain-containing protein [Streptomyces sp. GbtcB6]|uniref:DUF5134 domain-containing protein n=1 Tax=Streptomyces sp. GbtcB6 TaxID=2824751 RepID=UPI001C3022FA|nr:DUF5134 domain-containing protein [Streptomyces sp. GbtcB6]
MTATDVVSCMLTALFAAAAVRALRYALVSRSLEWRGRVDHLLHTAMALAMAVMPWNRGPGLPELPQTAFFATAALWFPLTAAGCRQRSRLAAAARRLPYAVGMAAMAWMTLSMAGPSHTPVAEGLPSEHQALHLSHSAGELKAGTVVTGVLALYLLVVALRSLTRSMPTLRSVSDAVAISTSRRELYGCFWDGSMALGTVIMLLMHP